VTGRVVSLIIPDYADFKENEPRRVKVGQSAFKVWFGAAKARLRSVFRSKCQSEQQMGEFIDKFKTEMPSEDHRLHSFSYERQRCQLIYRYITIGRRPDVSI